MKKLALVVALSVASSGAYAEDATPTPPTTDNNALAWKASFFGSLTLSTLFMSAGVYYYADMRSNIDDVRVSKPNDDTQVTQDDCGRPDIVDKNGVFTDVCRSRRLSSMMTLAALVMVPVVLTTGYMAIVHGKKRKPESRGVAIVPTVSPELAGATLDIRW